MELDELKQAWKTLELRIDHGNTLQMAHLRERAMSRLKSRLMPLMVGQIVQICFGISMIVAGVWLWTTFSQVAAVLVCGAILHVYGIVAVIAAGVVLAKIAALDASLPVIELQGRLLGLRKVFIASGAAVGLPWWLLWMVVPIVLAAGHAEKLSIAWLVGSAAVGCAGIVATIWFYRWSQRHGREDLGRRVENSAAGASLRNAQTELDALREFAKE